MALRSDLLLLALRSDLLLLALMSDLSKLGSGLSCNSLLSSVIGSCKVVVFGLDFGSSISSV